ncbi:hypothetical protein Bhyg_09194 [Pseudolycoriella hygida]|uniref:Uncharacterized protein n=1 Tax=Pseudolycoriella hygida TaxID=35572 RepID=A0A9Q0N627_9DIPT|nr:hypothetical protein Bhyg_09194 [Pseudolycoriella hygida]
MDFIRGDHDALATFLQRNCNNRPKKVQFKCSYLPTTFGDKMKPILEHAETVAFRNCLIDKTLLNDQYEQVEELLDGRHPKLEHFHCRYAGYPDMDQLGEFFRYNKVKSITWYFFRKHWNIIHACIEAIVEHAVNLEELFISIEGQNYNFTEICRKLKIISDRESFKRLELQFVGEEVERKLMSQGEAMASLTSLYGLHFCGFRNFQNVVPIIKQNPNIKILQFKKESENEEIVFPLPNPSMYHLPQLEQFHLVGLTKNLNYIHSYVLRSPKLKTVVVKDCAFTDFYLNALNAGRKEQPFACDTTIYTEQHNIVTDFSRDLVNIKKVNFEVEEFNLTDPFICHRCID